MDKRESELKSAPSHEDNVSLETAVVKIETGSLSPVIARMLLNLEEGIIFERRDNRTKELTSSILALDPLLEMDIENETATVSNKLNGETEIQSAEKPFDLIQKELERIQNLTETAEIPETIRFATGLIGYLGYGLVRSVEPIGSASRDPFEIPRARLMFPSLVIYFDHQTKETYVISHEGATKAERIAKLLVENSVSPLISQPSRRLEVKKMESRTQDSTVVTLQPITEVKGLSGLASSMPKERFLKMVDEAKASIEKGDAFQIVVSQRFFKETECSAERLFDELTETTPSTYGYLLKFKDFEYVGASPERLINLDKNRVSICALAGTRPRGESQREDDALEKSLTECSKERAEHLMLVDLGRNDLGRICKAGSIPLGPIAEVVRYSNVMHLCTELSGHIDEGVSMTDAVKSCFPRGTVSGAPKVRAMQLLSKMEEEERGIYAGAVGFFDTRGCMDFAIAIRSALMKDGKIHINAGAGIVYDSEPENEYQETINKAMSVARALGAAERKLALESEAMNIASIHGSEGTSSLKAISADEPQLLNIS